MPTLEEAMFAGLPKYDPDKPCGRGHMTPRYVRNRACIECNRISAAKYRKENYEKHRAYNKQWKRNNPKSGRETQALNAKWYRRKTKYGLTKPQLIEIMQGQDWKCAGCRAELTQAFNVDHCHNSGQVRGVLCRPCNLALGFVKDSTETLGRLIAYLDKKG